MLPCGAAEARVRDGADARERERRERDLAGPAGQRHERQRDERGAHTERDAVEVGPAQEAAHDQDGGEEEQHAEDVSRTVDTRSGRRSTLERANCSSARGRSSNTMNNMIVRQRGRDAASSVR